MSKWILVTGGILSGLSVLVGAFGAHSLKAILDANSMGWIDTGVEYQSTHALALIACGLLPYSRNVNRTAVIFCMGIILFSGSLYLMALTGIRTLGIVTPVGGVLLLLGWLSFCWSVLRLPSNKTTT